MITYLCFQTSEGDRKDFAMVEGKPGHLRYDEPACISGVSRCLGLMLGELYQRIIRNANHTLARITINSAEGIKLLQEHVGQPCLLLEFAARGRVQGFIHPDESTRHRPSAFERLQAALN